MSVTTPVIEFKIPLEVASFCFTLLSLRCWKRPRSCKSVREVIVINMKGKVTQTCSTLCDPMDWIDLIVEWITFPFSRGSSQPRDWTQVSHIAGGFFTSWATGKPKNTGVGSPSLLQQIFLTQESNWGLLNCRWILYQLSYMLHRIFKC